MKRATFDPLLNKLRTKDTEKVQVGGGGTGSSSSSSAPLITKDEGTTLTSTTSSLNFVGAGVSATNSGNDVTVSISGGGGGGHTIQEDAVSLTARTNLNFSTGITATDNAGNDATDITVTKSGIGLGNVDNTSDATKNAATATLTNKTLTSPAITTPTGIVKGDVGLGNVDNTSDVNKPVSTAQQTAIDAKVSDTVYGAGWNGDTTVAPSKNAVYDKIESLSAGGGHTIRDEGIDLAARTGLNFIGTGITATDDAGGNETEITLDADLNTIAGLTPTNDDILQRKAGAWANRTIAQLKTDLALSSTDVSDFTEAAQDATGTMVDASLNYVDGTPLLQRAALTGDVTASAGSNSTTIANDAVTYAKMQNMSTDKLLGRDTAASGDVEEIALNATLEFDGAGSIRRAALTGDATASAGSNATTVISASESQAGKVELATAAETTTGTDNTRAVSPDGLAGSDYGKRVIEVLVTDPNGSAITTGDGKAYIRIPAVMNGWNLVAVGAHVTTVSSSGIPTVQINNVTQAADMLTTKLTIDASEKDSSTAATAAVIDTANDDVATGDELRIDIDVAGTGAKGLIVDLTFQLP